MKSPRPKPVNVAIACIIASYLIATVQMFTRLNLSDWDNVIHMINVSIGECAIVLGIYFGKNWARWVFAATIAIWILCLVVYRLNEHAGFHGVALLLLALGLIFSVVSVILLFYPESNAWFRKQPAPADIDNV